MAMVRWSLAGLAALVLSGCPGSVPNSAAFGAADALQSQEVGQLDGAAPTDLPAATDASQPADVEQVSDAQVADELTKDAVAAELPPVDAPVAKDGGCAANGCTASDLCHKASCQVSGVCKEELVADGSSCGEGKSCHSGICLADPLKALHIAAGDYSTCALLSDGSIVCWGADDAGQLGDGNPKTAPQASPVAVKNVSGASELACGLGHCCAIVAGGKVRCWGDNEWGQCDPAVSAKNVLNASEVAGISGATAIALGDYHTCAVVADGKVRCWGIGSSGQLGDGQAGMPEAIVGAELGGYALEVQAGNAFTCARTALSQAFCWGLNDNGQIGNGLGGTSQFSYSPAMVGDFTNVSGLAVGGQHACALRKSGEIWCWGKNNSGELGNNGGNSYYTSPVQAVGMVGMQSVAAGGNHTCAVGQFGGVWCWGANSAGQTGAGKSVMTVKSPSQLTSMTDVAELEGGLGHTCARRSDGSVWCWGANSLGQCGVGGGKDVYVPVKAY